MQERTTNSLTRPDLYVVKLILTSLQVMGQICEVPLDDCKLLLGRLILEQRRERYLQACFLCFQLPLKTNTLLSKMVRHLIQAIGGAHGFNCGIQQTYTGKGYPCDLHEIVVLYEAILRLSLLLRSV